jgi:hypothetical protein
MTLVGMAEVITINTPLRGGYLGIGLTIRPDSSVLNSGTLSAKDR